MTTTVNDIEHIESQTLRGTSVVKVFFQPGAKIEAAIAQITAIAQSSLRQMPPGTNPPFIITYNASSVPILQLGLSGKGLSEQQLFDLGVNFIRTQLATVQGASIPLPVRRQAAADPGRSRSDRATGQRPVAKRRRQRDQCAEPDPSRRHVEDRRHRIRRADERQPRQRRRAQRPADQDGRDYSDLHPRRRTRPQRLPAADEHRSCRRPARRHADGPEKRATPPRSTSSDGSSRRFRRSWRRGCRRSSQIRPLADQSVFVSAAISGVIREAVIAACLTALDDPVFLGSWRSTVIIAVSIPLSILTSIIVLSALGETINIMTLGGLALAVGILVDDATVAIENINCTPGAGQAARAGDSRRRRPDCHARVRLDAVHLHRVRPDVLPQRRRAVSVRADGGSGRLRDARVLRALANARADDGEVPAEAACAGARRPR